MFQRLCGITYRAHSRASLKLYQRNLFSTFSANETILITGANRGLGLEFAKQYLATGNFNVIACCRSPDSATELNSLKSSNPDLLAIEKLDVSNEQDIETISNKYKNRAIDICLLNAGISGEIDANTQQRRRIGNLTKSDLLAVFDTNVIGPLLTAQAFLDNVAMSKKRKQFVCISSGMGSIQDNTGSGGSVSYRVSKAAVNCGLQDLKFVNKVFGDKYDNIHTLLLNPGWVQTDMGGGNATMAVKDSISNLMKVIDNYENIPNGAFYNHNGKPFGSELDENGNEKYPTGKF